jgi:hypothetical protein
MIRMCPRGDLNPETGEISLNLDLNTKTGEKSPVRGVHALIVASAPRPESSELRRLATEPGLPLRRDHACWPDRPRRAYCCAPASMGCGTRLTSRPAC